MLYHEHRPHEAEPAELGVQFAASAVVPASSLLRRHYRCRELATGSSAADGRTALLVNRDVTVGFLKPSREDAFYVTNADGDTTSSRFISYFTNVGGRFVQTPIPALDALPFSASAPVIATLDGSGNVSVTVTDAGKAYSAALDGPDAKVHMPPYGVHMIDAEGLALVRAWIASLPPSDCK